MSVVSAPATAPAAGPAPDRPRRLAGWRRIAVGAAILIVIMSAIRTITGAGDLTSSGTVNPFWGRWAGRVMAHPWLAAFVCVGIWELDGSDASTHHAGQSLGGHGCGQPLLNVDDEQRCAAC